MGTQWKKEFMTVKEVASELYLSRATVYRMISDGVIAHVTIGAGRGRIRVPRDEIRHYIDSLKAEARRNIAHV